MKNYKRYNLWIAALVFALVVLSGCKKEINSPNDEKNTDGGSWVVCYHPCYQWYTLDADIPWDKITHLILGYMIPYKNAENLWDIKVPDNFYYGQSGWIEKAKGWIPTGRQSGSKITCMLGGAGSNVGNNENFWTMATESGNVKAFAANIKSLLQPIGFDGVDLDWEERLDYAGFLRLVKELRAIWPEAIITIPTAAAGRDASGLAACSEYVDAFMPMSYMSVMQWGGWTLPVPPTPLFAYGNNPYSVEITLKKWTDAGVPASKIVMGVGGYGQVWGDTDGDGRAPNTPYSSTTTGIPEGERYPNFGDNSVTQKWLTQTITNHAELTEKWDDVGKCSYWSSPAPDNLIRASIRTNQFVDVGLIFYETKKSMQYKFDFITGNNMKGMMFWTLLMLKDEDNTFPLLDNVHGFKTAVK